MHSLMVMMMTTIHFGPQSSLNVSKECYSGQLSSVKELVKFDGLDINAVDGSGDSALIIAVDQGI